MMNHSPFSGSDLIGLKRLAADGVIGVAGVAQAMHDAVLSTPGLSLARTLTKPATHAAYGAVRVFTRVFSGCAEALIGPLLPALSDTTQRPEREAMLSIVNGVLGDHLERTENPLTIHMRLRRFGRPLSLNRQELARAIPNAGSRVLIQVHGLCRNDLQWTRAGHNHGHTLEARGGWTTLDLHYNSGLHISESGRRFSQILEQVISEWPVPVEELAILGHSAGGLVSRSACHYGRLAGCRWPEYLRHLVFLGTPHHGAVLERHGNWFAGLFNVTPYSAPLRQLFDIRSPGITDLRYGCIIDEHWHGVDRFHDTGDTRCAAPLPDGTLCYAVAGSASKGPGRSGSPLRGDGLVTVDSALGRHHAAHLTMEIDPARQFIACSTDHFDLLSSREVYQHLESWLKP